MEVEWLGTVEYGRAWELQKGLVAERDADPALPDKLLLLEHPPTYTMGRRGGTANLLYDEAQLAAEGITLYQVDRGGDITYHGPGQLVGYPILNLKRRNGRILTSVRPYIHNLEEVLIQAIRPLGIEGWRYEGFTGVWVGDPSQPRKIAAIGVSVNRNGITSHGFALNVQPNLAHFQGIIPCGIRDHAVTSIAWELQRDVLVQALLEPLQNAFQAIFHAE